MLPAALEATEELADAGMLGFLLALFDSLMDEARSGPRPPNDLTLGALNALAFCFLAKAETLQQAAPRISRSRLEALVRPMRSIELCSYVLEPMRRGCRAAEDSLLVMKALAPILLPARPSSQSRPDAFPHASQAATSIFTQFLEDQCPLPAADVLAVAEDAVSVFSQTWGSSDLGAVLELCTCLSGQKTRGAAFFAGLSPQALRLSLQILLYSGADFNMFDVLDAAGKLVHESPAALVPVPGGEDDLAAEGFGAVLSQEISDRGGDADQYNACLASFIARCFSAVCEQHLAVCGGEPEDLLNGAAGHVSRLLGLLLDDLSFLLARLSSAAVLSGPYASPDFLPCVSFVSRVYGHSFPWTFVSASQDWPFLLECLYHASGASRTSSSESERSAELPSKGQVSAVMHWVLCEAISNLPCHWISPPHRPSCADLLMFLSDHSEFGFLEQLAARIGSLSGGWSDPRAETRVLFLLAARRAGVNVFDLFSPDALANAMAWLHSQGSPLVRLCFCFLGRLPLSGSETGSPEPNLRPTLMQLAAHMESEASQNDSTLNGELALSHLCKAICGEVSGVIQGDQVYDGVVAMAVFLLLAKQNEKKEQGKTAVTELLAFSDELRILKAFNLVSLHPVLASGNILYSFPETKAISSHIESLVAAIATFRELEPFGFLTTSLLQPKADHVAGLLPDRHSHLSIDAPLKPPDDPGFLTPTLVAALGCVLRECGIE